MSIEIKESEPQPEIPKAKTLIIGGKEMGKATPSISGDRLSWHSCIELKKRPCDTWLVQGFGNSPADAIQNSIVRARRTLQEQRELLAWLEEQLGTATRSDEVLERDPYCV